MAGTEIILSPAPALQPAPLFTPTPKAARRVLEFFTAQVNNDNTRKAYLNATRRFAAWCDEKGIAQLADVQPVHVAAFVKELQGEFTAPTVKQHLAALRMLFCGPQVLSGALRVLARTQQVVCQAFYAARRSCFALKRRLSRVPPSPPGRLSPPRGRGPYPMAGWQIELIITITELAALNG